MPTRTPAKKRAIKRTKKAAPISDALRDLAEKNAQAHKDKNAANNVYNKTRKALHGEMEAAKLESFECEGVVDGHASKLTAEIKSGVGSFIDIKKLQSMVSEEVFMECIAAQVGLVEKAAGKNIAEACKVEFERDPAVTVKVEVIR